MPLNRELAVARILWGRVRLRPEGHPPVLMGRPSRERAYLAEEAHEDALREAALEGLMTEEQALAHLVEMGLWGEALEEEYRSIPKRIDSLKESLYRAVFRSNERARVRKELAQARARRSRLDWVRSAHSPMTDAAFAASARARHLMAASLCSLDGRPLYPADEYLSEDDGLVEACLAAYAAVRFGEADYRELARTEPWRGAWSCRKADGLFGVCAADYTEEQRLLSSFSSLYDSVYEHPDCPDDSVIDDDDMLDGWLIVQRKEREARRAKKSGEEALGGAAGDEVFIVCDTPEDAARVYAMNDAGALAAIESRFGKVRKEGAVDEGDFADVRAKRMMQAAQAMKAG